MFGRTGCTVANKNTLRLMGISFLKRYLGTMAKGKTRKNEIRVGIGRTGEYKNTSRSVCVCIYSLSLSIQRA